MKSPSPVPPYWRALAGSVWEKRLENPLARLFRDADAGILDFAAKTEDGSRVSRPTYPYGYPSLVGELQGVAYHVGDDLLETDGIPYQEPGQVRSGFEPQIQVLAARFLLERAQDGFDERFRIRRGYAPASAYRLRFWKDPGFPRW